MYREEHCHFVTSIQPSYSLHSASFLSLPPSNNVWTEYHHQFYPETKLQHQKPTHYTRDSLFIADNYWSSR